MQFGGFVEVFAGNRVKPEGGVEASDYFDG